MNEAKKEDILLIVVILTPFHLIQMEAIINQYDIKFNRLLIFKSQIISDSDINEKLGSYSYISYNVEIGLIKLAKLRLSYRELKRVKLVIRNYEKIINKENYIYFKNIKLFLGNENDLFSQLLILHLQQYDNLEINGFDEGVGHYRTEKNMDIILRKILPIFTNLLFSRKLTRYKSLGNASFFKNLYLRFPNLKKNTKNINLLEIGSKKRGNRKYVMTDKIIIFSSPLEEDNIKTKVEPYLFIKKLVDVLKDSFKIYLKPHPREDISKYYRLKDIYLINNLKRGEELELFKFSNIILFNSSIIIELLSINYPKKHIININPKLANRNKFSFFDGCPTFSMDYNGVNEIHDLIKNEDIKKNKV